MNKNLLSLALLLFFVYSTKNEPCHLTESTSLSDCKLKTTTFKSSHCCYLTAKCNETDYHKCYDITEEDYKSFDITKMKAQSYLHDHEHCEVIKKFSLDCSAKYLSIGIIGIIALLL